MERGFTSMTTSGAASVSTSSSDLIQDIEANRVLGLENSHYIQKNQVQKDQIQKDSDVTDKTQGTKQNTSDTKKLRNKGWANTQLVEQSMPSASLENSVNELLETEQDASESSTSLLANQLNALASSQASLDTLDSKQRLQILMEEFKSLLERYQQQTLKLAKSFSKITDNETTDIDLSTIGSIAIKQEELDGYEFGLAQLTHTLTTMESELESVLRKSEYQELSRQDLEAAHLEMLEHLANTSETRCSGTLEDTQNAIQDANKNQSVKDEVTKGKHLDRVGELCAKIAQVLGCDDTFVNNIASSARLHDIGKLAIPDTILQKPDRLDADEYATMKMHTLHGAKMLANNSNEIIQMAYRIALSHHENWDGTGYPYQLKQKEIALEGRIAAVADVYDALISSRIYKEAWPKEKAIEQIKSRSGTKFDPVIVEAFLKVMNP